MAERSNGALSSRSQTASSMLTPRLLAFIIDWYVGGLVTALPVALSALSLGRSMVDQDITGYVAPFGLIAGASGVALGLMYYVVVPMALPGQTLGKKVCRVRIVRVDGGFVGLARLLLRQGICLILLEGAAVGTGTVVRQMVQIAWGPLAAGDFLLAGIAMTLASIVACFTRRDSRAIHDLIAGTRVVLDDKDSGD